MVKKTSTIKKKPHKIKKNRSKKKPRSILLQMGWLLKLKTRNNGKSQGQIDKYFISPDNQTFRSVVEMNKYITEQDMHVSLHNKWVIDGTNATGTNATCVSSHLDSKGQSVRSESPHY